MSFDWLEAFYVDVENLEVPSLITGLTFARRRDNSNCDRLRIKVCISGKNDSCPLRDML